MRKDITEIFLKYRECARHLWNAYFKELEDGWNLFINVEREIYESMIFEQIYKGADYKSDEREYVKTFKVEPQTNLDKIEVLWNDRTNENHIDWRIIKIDSLKVELRFVDFFDWDENGFRDYKYIKCFVISSEVEPNLLNTEMLLETDSVKILFKKTV